MTHFNPNYTDPYERDEDICDEEEQEERGGYDRYDLDRDLENEGEW